MVQWLCGGHLTRHLSDDDNGKQQHSLRGAPIPAVTWVIFKDPLDPLADPLQFIFRDGYRKERTGNVKVTLLSQKRLEIFLRAIFVLLTTILFLVPVFILLRLQPSYQDEVRHKENLQLVTILAFTLTFSASCSIFTKAKRQEVFMATGAYCAVLVVFLGNTQNAIINNAMEAPRFQSHPTGVNLVGQLARDPSLTA